MNLITNDARISSVFRIQHQVTIVASGFQDTDTVVFDVVSLTRSAPSTGDVCCPGPVSLPDFASSTPLTTCDNRLVKLTATKPWVVIDMPQQVPLVARVLADDDAVIEVDYYETDSQGIVCV